MSAETNERQKSISYRSFSAGEETAILRLFRECYSSELAREFWLWRFANAPAGQGIIELAWDGDQPSGHYAATPVALSLSGTERGSALSGTTMTHPDYRGLGLFPALAKRAYDRMRDAGMVAVWGFPNVNSHRGFIQDLGWIDLAEIPTFRLANESATRVPKCEAQVIDVAAADVRWDSLWASVAGRFAVATQRSSAYLNWRFFRNPSERYTMTAVESSGAIDGYAVFKQYRSEYQIVDVLARQPEIAVQLVLDVVDRARRAQMQAVALWMNFANELHRRLERFGFVNDTPITYFGILPLDGSSEVSAMRDARNWYYVMGDSDVF